MLQDIRNMAAVKVGTDLLGDVNSRLVEYREIRTSVRADATAVAAAGDVARQVLESSEGAIESAGAAASAAAQAQAYSEAAEEKADEAFNSAHTATTASQEAGGYVEQIEGISGTVSGYLEDAIEAKEAAEYWAGQAQEIAGGRAVDVTFTVTEDLLSTNVQDAIEEVDTGWRSAFGSLGSMSSEDASDYYTKTDIDNMGGGDIGPHTHGMSDITGLTDALSGKADNDGIMASVVAGSGISVDNTDPANPVVSATGGSATGDVSGPSSAADGEIALFDGTTGKLIKSAGITLASKVDQTYLDARLTDVPELVPTPPAGANYLYNIAEVGGVWTPGVTATVPGTETGIIAGGTLPARTEYGQIRANSPVANNDLTNKEYVDGLLSANRISTSVTLGGNDYDVAHWGFITAAPLPNEGQPFLVQITNVGDGQGVLGNAARVYNAVDDGSEAPTSISVIRADTSGRLTSAEPFGPFHVATKQYTDDLFSGLGTAAAADTGDFAAASHTHTAAQISDASANGRSLITAANYAAMRTAMAVATAAQGSLADTALQPGDAASASDIRSFSGSGHVTGAGLAGAAAPTSGVTQGGGGIAINWTSFISGSAVSLSANRAMSNPSNVVPGTTRSFVIQSSSGAERAVSSWGSSFVGDLPDIAVTNTVKVLVHMYAYDATHIQVSASPWE